VVHRLDHLLRFGGVFAEGGPTFGPPGTVGGKDRVEGKTRGRSGWIVLFYGKEGGAVSRFLFLNLPFIFATYPPASDGPPSSAGIFGLAGLPPYPPHVAIRRRGLLPRVFTLAGEKKEKLRRLFSVTDGKDYSLLCFPQSGALPCADFPHRRDSFAALGRPSAGRKVTARQIVPPSGCKGTFFYLNL